MWQIINKPIAIKLFAYLYLGVSSPNMELETIPSSSRAGIRPELLGKSATKLLLKNLRNLLATNLGHMTFKTAQLDVTWNKTRDE